jgi:hypothetical protein
MREPTDHHRRLPPKLYALHLTTMLTLAAAQPLYDVLSREDHATFFIAHESKAIDILLFVALLSVLLPAAIILIVAVAKRLSRGLAAVVYFVLFALLAAAAVQPSAAKLFPTSTGLSVSVGTGMALAFTALYAAASPVRTFVTFMSPVILLSPLLFLANAPMRPFLAAADSQDFKVFSDGPTLPTIVMIVFDELPLTSLLDERRLIDEVRYPNFHALSETSSWYRNTTTVHYTTSGALPSLLIGAEYRKYFARLPRAPGPRTALLDRRNVPLNLFSLLENSHRIVALESTSRLAPENQSIEALTPALSERFAGLVTDAAILYGHLVLPVSLRGRLPVIEGQWSNFAGDPARVAEDESSWPYSGRASRVKQFLDLLEKRREPSLYFLHLLLPHFPFQHDERGAIHPSKFPFVSENLRKATGTNQWPNETTADLAYQAHLLQVSFTDRLLGHILDRLRQLGLFDESLIIVTADHGISFFWDDVGLPAERLSDIQASETFYVPLLIKKPGQRKGVISDMIAQTIDIVPTIADFLQLEIPWQVDGLSLLRDIPQDRERSASLPAPRTFGAIIDPEHTALLRKVKLFGTHSFEGIYRYGPHPELLGRPVEALASRPSTDIVTIENQEEFETIDPANNDRPAYVEASISGTRSSPTTFAVAINGIIKATARATRVAISSVNQGGGEDDEETIHVLARLPPEAFAAGMNRVTIHGIVDDGKGNPISLLSLALE